ncbi:hypothetical protein ACNTMW_14105 [Planosporangium sp. 12N6]|uniref:hypothetical protein n=1 Tax=Planosporangium spinosum TaxID=3402278 RepID=UPI003CF6F488
MDCYLLLDGHDRLVAMLVEHAYVLAADGAARLALAGNAAAGEWLREFRAQLRPWDHTSAVRTLDERLAELTA